MFCCTILSDNVVTWHYHICAKLGHWVRLSLFLGTWMCTADIRSAEKGFMFCCHCKFEGNWVFLSQKTLDLLMTSSMDSCFAAVVNLNLTTNSPHFLKEKHYIHSVGSERVNSLTNLYHMIHFVSLRFTVHELFCSIHLLLGEAVLCFFCKFFSLKLFL